MTNRDFINLNSNTNIGNKTKLMFAVKHCEKFPNFSSTLLFVILWQIYE
jgi:hypothetical protein